MYNGLQDGMVGTVEFLSQGKRAFAEAVVGQVTLWSNDPILPTDFSEADVQPAGFANVAGGGWHVVSAAPFPGVFALPRSEGNHQQGGAEYGIQLGT